MSIGFHTDKPASAADLPHNDDRTHVFGEHISTEFSKNSQPKEKRMLLDTSSSSNGGEIFVGSMSERIDGVLDITIHHATDIQNICIYGNQDVYAKFSITHSQDKVYSTQPVRAGGKNPVFNQSLQILISQPDAVLKCEIWMMSCVRTYLEDQLLGFVLVPLADLIGKDKETRNHTLSSTDLFHAPAGTVCLSLRFYSRDTLVETPVSASQRSPDVMLLENGNQNPAPMDYNNIEFPDLQAASENQQLVSVYLKMASDDLRMDATPSGQECSRRMATQQQEFSGASFLQLGSSPMAEVDCEMAINTGEEKSEEITPVSSDDLTCASDDTSLSVMEAPPSSPSASTVPTPTSEEQNSMLGPTTTTSTRSLDSTTSATCFFGNGSQATPSPRSGSSVAAHSSSDDKENSNSDGQESGGSFTAPVVSISMEPEESVVQQQIVDMYMKSMQQFTESLSNMKLPLDLDGGQACPELKDNPRADKKASTEPGKKDGHRVFYGSRAFF